MISKRGSLYPIRVGFGNSLSLLFCYPHHPPATTSSSLRHRLPPLPPVAISFSPARAFALSYSKALAGFSYATSVYHHDHTRLHIDGEIFRPRLDIIFNLTTRFSAHTIIPDCTLTYAYLYATFRSSRNYCVFRDLQT